MVKIRLHYSSGAHSTQVLLILQQATHFPECHIYVVYEWRGDNRRLADILYNDLSILKMVNLDIKLADTYQHHKLQLRLD